MKVKISGKMHQARSAVRAKFSILPQLYFAPLPSAFFSPLAGWLLLHDRLTKCAEAQFGLR